MKHLIRCHTVVIEMVSKTAQQYYQHSEGFLEAQIFVISALFLFSHWFFFVASLMWLITYSLMFDAGE